jgi:hypothetical protein
MSQIPNETHEVKTVFNSAAIKKTVKTLQEYILILEAEGVVAPFDQELVLLEKFPEFYQDHPNLVKKICKKDNLDMLYKMLDNLDNVESGNKSLSSVELDLGNKLANQYLYPSLNKK